ncbi:hypothetical protein [Streptomyces adustus]|uniref:hypothetical protein n=1 Tax=Streptomyces adustus TaxID=1609272 RepID=UPI003718FF74
MIHSSSTAGFGRDTCGGRRGGVAFGVRLGLCGQVLGELLIRTAQGHAYRGVDPVAQQPPTHEETFSLHLSDLVDGKPDVSVGLGVDGFQETHRGRVTRVRFDHQPFPRRGQVFPRRFAVVAQQRDPGADHTSVHLLDGYLYVVFQALHGREVGVGVVEPAEPQIVLALCPQQHRLTHRPRVVRCLQEQPSPGREVVRMQVRDDHFGKKRGIDGAERGEALQGDGVLTRVLSDLAEPGQRQDVRLPVTDRGGGPQRGLAGLTGRGEIQVPQRRTEGGLQPAEHLQRRSAGQQPVTDRQRLPTPAGPGQAEDRLLTHLEPQRPCGRHQFKRTRHQVGREPRRDRQHILGGSPQQRHGLLVSGQSAPEDVRHRVDRLVARGHEAAGSLPMQSLPCGWRDVDVDGLAQQIMPEDQLVAVVVKKSGAHRLLERRNQHGGRLAVQREPQVRAYGVRWDPEAVRDLPVREAIGHQPDQRGLRGGQLRPYLDAPLGSPPGSRGRVPARGGARVSSSPGRA